jgi:hypothetical protein
MINLNYDSEGKINQINIYIQEDDSWIPVQIDLQTLEIDWDSITYPPTRESIRSAWEAWAKGKDVAYELRDRPELTPPQSEPQPDWNALKFAFLGNSGYQRITLQSTAILAVTRLENAVIDYVSGMRPTYSLIKFFWDAIIGGILSSPTVSEVASWNAIALNTHMKFSFDADGKMILS